MFEASIVRPAGWLSAVAVALVVLLGVAAPAAARVDPYHGTAIVWAGSPDDAAAAAKASGKLVAVLHLAGELPDPGLT